MRQPLVIGNWKMNLSAEEGQSLVEGFRGRIPDGVECAICPTMLALPHLLGKGVMVGAQYCFWVDSGAYTSQVSATMLSEAGVSWCLVGHSETRGRFGKSDLPEGLLSHFHETDETCGLKVEACRRRDIRPVLCVGETISERNGGHTEKVIETQLSGGLAKAEGIGSEVVIAYEPVWAIGTGETCDSEEADRVCGFIRAWLRDHKPEMAENRILYGGSVKPENAAELFARPEIDGGLIGGASLNADDFAAILLAAA